MTPFYEDRFITLYNGDVREVLPQLDPETVQTCVTSPPYFGLRDYGTDGQLGLEETPDAYVSEMTDVFREVRRVLRDDGTLWLNLGDSYCGSTSETPSNREGSPIAKGTVASQEQRAGRGQRTKAMINHGIKPKDLIGIPWRTAFSLQSDGWWLRQDIIWHKPNPMPESVRDRCTKAHEYIFLMAKAQRYFYDADAIAEQAINANQTVTLGPKSFSKGQAVANGKTPSGNGASESYTVVENRNRRSVWTVTTQPFKEAHFATFPKKLIEPCILAGSREGDIVLDPFAGSGTTLVVAKQHGRRAIGIELNPEYCEMTVKRIKNEATLPLLEAV